MKFSIAMCTYNGARHVREQIESFVGQTRLPDELVVCDDGSSDGTREILTDLKNTLPFPVRLQFNRQNLGYIKNFERAIELCTGDIIALSDQDDVWNADKVSRFEQVFRSSDKIGLVYADAELVDESLRPKGTTMWQGINFNQRKQREFANGHAFDLLLADGHVLGSSAMFRAEYKSLILPIPLDIYFVHDNWIALMVTAVADAATINRSLIKYRQHEQQASSGVGKSQTNAINTAITSVNRKNEYTTVINQLAIAEQRLRVSDFDAGENLAKLRAAMQHLQIRGELPGNFFARTVRVGRELLAKRYHLYSNGLHSAVKDLLVKPATQPTR